MNTEQAQQRLEDIENIGDYDDAGKHKAEDALRLDALSHISKHSTDEESRRLAAKVLESSDIKFGRWYE